MKKIDKKDMPLTVNNKNAVLLTSTLDGFAQVATYLAIIFLSIGTTLLSLALTKSQNNSPLIFAIITFAILTVGIIAVVAVTAYFKKTPNLIFIGNKMYIKANKDWYLELSPDDLENYNLYTTTFSGHKMLNQEIYYSTCSHWGKAELLCNGETYKVNCDSLAKAKHYLDGFKNNISAEENTFEGDFLQKYFKTSLLLLLPLLVGILMVVQSFIIDGLKLWWLELIIGCVVTLVSLSVIITYAVKNHKRHKEESMRAINNFVLARPTVLPYGAADKNKNDENNKLI